MKFKTSKSAKESRRCNDIIGGDRKEKESPKKREQKK